MKAALGGAAAAAVLTAPRIKGFSLAPDYAAAASCVPMTQLNADLAFGTATNQNGWQQSITGTFESTTQNLGVGTGWWALGSAYAHIVERNNIAAMTVTYRRTVSLKAGGVYTFSFRSSGTVTNPITQTLVAALRSGTATSGANLGSTSFTTAEAGMSNGWLRTHTFTTVAIPTEGLYTFTFTHTAPARTGTQANDDIGVTAPTVTCL